MDTAYAKYNWRGEVTGYLRGPSHIPVDPGNTDYQRLVADLSNKGIALEEPNFQRVTKTYNKNGFHSGYRTSQGFVPLDKNNKLSNLVQQQILDGTCTVEEPQSAPAVALDCLLLCVLFSEPWHHVRGEFTGRLAYASHSQAASHEYGFSLFNTRGKDPQCRLALLLDHHHAANPLLPHRLIDVANGVLQISVPVTLLRRLFMGERANSSGFSGDLIADLFEQHLVETGRRRSEGPDIAWLIQYAHLYLRHFVAEFSNRILEAFLHEYGLTPAPFVSERELGNSCIFLARTTAGQVQLHQFLIQPPQSFGLDGAWPTQSLHKYQAQVSHAHGYQGLAFNRIRAILGLGLHMEALSLLNAVLEVAVTSALSASLRADNVKRAAIRVAGYSEKLRLLEASARHSSDQYLNNSEFFETIGQAKEIYRIRNNYLHELLLPDMHTARVSTTQRRAIETLVRPFVDLWQQQFWFRRLDRVRDDPGVTGFLQGAIPGQSVPKNTLYARTLGRFFTFLSRLRM